jgi:hypothetical protein
LDDFDWHGGAITRATPVAPSYRSTQNVRRFLHAECGDGFKFDRPFMQWIKDGAPKTMGAVADEWRRRQGDARSWTTRARCRRRSAPRLAPPES